MLNERLEGFAEDVLTLSRIWEKNITVTVSGYTFTGSCGLVGSIRKQSGGRGSTHLAEIRSYPSGQTEVQWLLTSQNT